VVILARSVEFLRDGVAALHFPAFASLIFLRHDHNMLE
jgi:hypothetical protein